MLLKQVVFEDLHPSRTNTFYDESLVDLSNFKVKAGSSWGNKMENCQFLERF